MILFIKIAPSVEQRFIDRKVPTLAPINTSTQHNDEFTDINLNKPLNDLKIPFTGFIQNKGQVQNSEIYFYYCTAQSFIGFGKSNLFLSENRINEEGEVIEVFSFDLTFLGSNEVMPKGKFRMNHVVNYFKGKDSFTGLMCYKEIWYHSFYDNIDLRYYMTQNGLKYDFIIHPGGNPDEIIIQVSDNFDIVIRSNEVEFKKKSNYETVFTDSSLKIYQENKRINANFVSKIGKRAYGFYIPNFDNSIELIIDPLIINQASYYGTSSAYDKAAKIDRDGWGNIYFSGDNSAEIRILKLDSTGSNIVYLSIIDGNGLDSIYGMAVDQKGQVYMSGVTRSTDFPMVNAAEPTIKGTQDGWAGLLNKTGNGFNWTTYVGGDADVNDLAWGITFDSVGDAYVTGMCYSPSTYNFTFVNAYSTSSNGVLVKINSTTGEWIYSTSTGMSRSHNVIVDSSFNPIVIGETSGTTFPLLNAIQPTYGGNWDSFVVKFNSDASSILFSTFFGGSGTDSGYFLDFDSEENIIIGGTTSSSDFNTTSAAFQQSFAGDYDFFLAKLNGTDYNLSFSTYVGGNNTESFTIIGGYKISDIDLDDSNNIYLTSGSYSMDYPTTNDALDRINDDGGADGIISVLSENGSKLLYSSFIGSNGIDSCAGVYVNGSFDQDNFNLLILSSVNSDELVTHKPIQDFINARDYYIMNLRNPDEPIYVTNNADFITEGFSGKGTQQEPYILEDYHFIDSTQTLIHIQDTTAYFEIKKCQLSAVTGSRPGVYLWNVSRGTIANNTIHHCSDGIKLDSSCENNTLIGNTLYNNSHYAIYVDNYSNKTVIADNIIFNQTNDGIVLGDAHKNTLFGNFISHTRYGIALSNRCNGNNLSKNIVAHNSENGIYIYNSHNNFVYNNTIHNNNNCGIYLRLSSNNMIFNSNIYNNGFAGIYSSSSSENAIIMNEIHNHSGGGDFGIYLGPSSTNNSVSNNTMEDNWYGIYIENTAFNNTIFDNNLDNVYSLYLRPSAGFNRIYRNNFLSIVIDNNGTNIFHYEGLGNYWGSAYTGSDINFNGIGDTPHTFTSNQDPFPLMYPAEWYFSHNILKPTLLHPNGGETLSGEVIVQWEAGIDSWGHMITYSVHYSEDAGNTWIQLVSGQTSTSYTWDLTALSDHSNYMVKVVATCSEDLSAYDISDALFTIQNQITTTTIPTTTITTTTTTTTTTMPTTTKTTTTTITTPTKTEPTTTGPITTSFPSTTASKTTTEKPASVTSFPGWMFLILLLSIVTIVLKRKTLKRGI